MLKPVAPASTVLGGWREALHLVRTRSTNLQAAHARIEVARGQSRMALAQALPRLTATGVATRHLITGTGFNSTNGTVGTIPDPQQTLSANATLSVPLFAPRAWFDSETASDTVEKVSLDAHEVERRVVGGLAEAVVAVVMAERLAEVTRVNLAAALSILELNKARARLGSGTSIDVLRAEQEVAQSRTQVIVGDEGLRKARESLGRALGYSHGVGVSPTISLNQLGSDARAACSPEKSVDERADVRAARAARSIAERNVSSVSRSYLPTLTAQTAVDWNSNRFVTGNGEHVTWTIGGILNWNLFEGGLRHGELVQNEGLLDLAEQHLTDAQRDAELQVVQASREVEVAESALVVARASSEAATKSARLARVQFVNGGGSSFDVFDTQRNAREAEIDVTIREFDLLRAQIAAFLALASCDL